jgi:HD-like signal output (HDOD) protein
LEGKPSQALESWVNRLSRQEMPIFMRTAQYVSTVATRESSSVAELARGILQDASLTARVLRLANSIYYNPNARAINTITRAIMLLGFETVRSMCASYTLIESVGKLSQREHASKEMARSLHAAFQARRFALHLHDHSPEEVFIAALLSRIGQIAFWCLCDDMADELETAIKRPGYNRARAEQELLGFRLHQLTHGLSVEWQLSPLLQQAMEGQPSGDRRVNAIILAERLAGAVEHGWDRPEVRSAVKKSADFLKLPMDLATAMVFSSTRAAIEAARYFGWNERLVGLIPTPPERLEGEEGEKPEESPYPLPDRSLQRKIMNELYNLMKHRQLDINTLFSILLEGIYRGIGMDRVLFALLTPDRKHLKGKYGLGWVTEDAVGRFVLESHPEVPHIFSHVLATQRPIWVTSRANDDVRALLTAEVSEFFGYSPFYVMAIGAKNQAIGVIYTDRQPSGRALDEESFESFKHFGLQANIFLSHLAR